jgi:GT2 family glycosyltransferase
MLSKQAQLPTMTTRLPAAWPKLANYTTEQVASHIYPNVVVIIPAWNRLDDTIECLYSLFKTEYPGLYVIVVDNGSDKGFSEGVVEIFPEVAIVHSMVNMGFVGGINAGLDLALSVEADYIFLLNNDTIVDRDAILKLVEAAESCSQYQIFSPLIAFADHPELVWFGGGLWNSKKATVSIQFLRAPITSAPADIYKTDWSNGCALFANRKVFEAVGPLDSAYFALWDEVDWCLRAKSQGFACAIQPKSRILHKVSSTFGSQQSYRYVYLDSRNRLIIIRKFSGRLRLVTSAIGQSFIAFRFGISALFSCKLRKLFIAVAMMQGNIDAIIGRDGPPNS